MNEASAIIPVFIAFAISAVLGPVVIPVLTRLKMDQTERELGVKSHLAKAGTPTMGGIMILISVTATALIYIWRYPKIGPVLFLTLAFGLIGFLDDYLKVVKKQSDGLLPKQKFALQIVVTAVFCAYLVNLPGTSLMLRIPFAGGKMADIGLLAYPLLFFAVIGTVNGVNFTDGLDGLASSVTIVVAAFFTAASLIVKAGAAPISAAAAGALMGFLLYNAYPAKVFMGDTGSLALGGFVAGMAYMLQMPIFILIVGLIYLLEVLSVMLQVGWFKYTKNKYGEGRRILKMAPLHHHFELCGWSETKTVAVFTVVTALLSLLGLLGL
jgi:phospho-N-acetylmuramoyl-pentapeptide-transferase